MLHKRRYTMLLRDIVLSACIAVLPILSFADDMVARSGKDSLRLTQAPCVAKVHVPDNVKEKLKASVAILNGVTYPACWAPHASGNVIVWFEDGDMGAVPITLFHPEKGI